MKLKCLRCGVGWKGDPAKQAPTCPGCGSPEWSKEYDLENYVGARNEYFVVGERVGEGHLMTLEVSGTWNRAANAAVPLCHRLKEDYRHRKGDLAAHEGRELVVSFDRRPGDSAGRWEITVRRRTPQEMRKELTDACERHRWAIRAVRESYAINNAADRIHCACPTEPACEVCAVAGKFAEDRRRPGSDGTRYWADLQHAVGRDLGLLA
jgi:hypothetical protein